MNAVKFSALLLTFFALPFSAWGEDDFVNVVNSPLTANDLSSLSGLDIYKCEFPVQTGQKLRGAMYAIKAEGVEPVRIMESETEVYRDGMAVFRAMFLREDRTLASVFLSDEKNMEFRFEWSGVVGGGLTGIVGVPLNDLPRANKSVQIHGTPKKIAPGTYELCLVRRVEKAAGGLAPGYPQYSLRVEIGKKPD
jgi:hypothetical protein